MRFRVMYINLLFISEFKNIWLVDKWIESEDKGNLYGVFVIFVNKYRIWISLFFIRGWLNRNRKRLEKRSYSLGNNINLVKRRLVWGRRRVIFNNY